MIQHIKIKNKIAIIVAPFVISLCIALYFFLSLGNKNIYFTNTEHTGLATLEKSINLLTDLTDLNIIFHGYHAGIIQDTSAITSQISNVENSLAKLSSIDTKTINILQLDQNSLVKYKKQDIAFDSLAKGLEAVKRSNNSTVSEFEAAYSSLRDSVNNLIAYIGDKSNLILDPELDTYYLMDSVLVALPGNINRLGNIYSSYINNLAKKDIASISKSNVAIDAYMLINNDLSKVNSDVSTALRENPNFHGASPSLLPSLSQDTDSFNKKLQTLADSLNDLALGLHLSAEDFHNKLLASRDISKQLLSKQIHELSILFDRRMSDLYGFTILALSMVSIALALSFLAYFFVFQAINKPILFLTARLNDVANGKLALNEQYSTNRDEIGTICLALNLTVNKIRETLSQIISASQNVNSAANEISAAGNDLATRTEQQAANLENTSASVAEINTIASQNNIRLKEVTKMSQSAKEVATVANEVVAQTIIEVNKIEASSKQISAIIAMIDEITFQTNLLALNAAVEAARAGDAGKGFGVVASEVRALANRSSNASKDIKAIINNSNAQVSSGVKLVHQVEEQLKLIVESTNQMENLVSQSSAAISDQALNINSISKTIGSMEQATQQNAALTEETSAAVQSLTEQTTQLEQTLRFFKI